MGYILFSLDNAEDLWHTMNMMKDALPPYEIARRIQREIAGSDLPVLRIEEEEPREDHREEEEPREERGVWEIKF